MATKVSEKQQRMQKSDLVQSARDHEENTEVNVRIFDYGAFQEFVDLELERVTCEKSIR